MKYFLGIDYGSKISGLARADADSEIKIAQAWSTVKTNELLNFVMSHKDEITKVVIGRSLNLSGKENPIAKQAKEFAQKLQDAGLEVEFEDERFTTQGALALQRMIKRKSKTRKPQNKERVDAFAAAQILQSYLDKLK